MRRAKLQPEKEDLLSLRNRKDIKKRGHGGRKTNKKPET